MASTYHRDRFDEIPPDLERVGAHRSDIRSNRGWKTFAWAALASGLLVLAGVTTLSVVDSRFSIDLPWAAADPTAPPTDSPEVPQIEPITDPGLVDPALGLQISVLNGSPTAGQQKVAGDQLAALGWPIASMLKASENDIQETVVYYRSGDFEAIAKGLVETLGVGTVQLSDAFQGAPITIVLGADYGAPVG